MDLKVTWSPEAVEDLESISEYIARDSVHYAAAVVSKILKKSRSLCDFPQIGRTVPEVNDPSVRECFVYSYRLVYRIQEETILVAAIVHGKQRFEDFSERFE